MRTWLHVPHGFLIAVLLGWVPHLGWALLLTFLVYECYQGFRENDQGYRDLESMMIGLAVGGLGIWIWQFF